MSPNPRLSQSATCTPRAAGSSRSWRDKQCFLTRDIEGPTSPFNWPRLTMAGLARKVFATSSVGRETRAAIESAAQADDTALGLVELALVISMFFGSRTGTCQQKSSD